MNLNRGPKGIKKWGNDLLKVLDSLPDGIIPQIGLAFNKGKDGGIGLDKEVLAGNFDLELELFYEILNDLNRASFVRIGYEFEGDWNGYSPESFKKVFVKISNAIKQRKINCATVWCSAGGSANFMPINKLMEYYPGDDFVDWWGIDIFSASEFFNENLSVFFKMANKHKKPIMIGESTPRYVGVSEGEKSWKKWFAPYFDMIYSNPGIKAFCYINWDWNYWSSKLGFSWGDWGDARIEKNKDVLLLYKKEMENPIFIHLNNK